MLRRQAHCHVIFRILISHLLVLIVMSGTSCMAKNIVTDNSVAHDDTQALIEKVIDLNALNNYYHVDELPQRKPLRILINKVVTKSYQHIKFDIPVLYVVNEPHMVFDSISSDNGVATVVFRYLPEGLRVEMTLKKTLHWEVIESELTEQ